MRGSPLLHVALAIAAFALFAIPLSRVTHARVPSEAGVAPFARPATSAVHTFIRVRLAHLPKSLSLKLDGREMLPSSAPSSLTFEAELSIAIIKDGTEFTIAAQWPEGTPDTAVTVEIEPDELDSRKETVWSSGPALDGIIHFSW